MVLPVDMKDWVTKELQNNNSDTYFFAYKIKTNYFMTKQVVWTFRKFFLLQFDTKFASKQQRLAKIDTILWLLLSTQIWQVWLATGKIRGRTGEKADITKHACPVVDPYRPLLALPQKAGSFKFKLACIGGESEWKIISSKAGAGYFGHNELN